MRRTGIGVRGFSFRTLDRFTVRTSRSHTQPTPSEDGHRCSESFVFALVDLSFVDLVAKLVEGHPLLPGTVDGSSEPD